MAQKLMSAVIYFVWDYFTSLLYSIKIYIFNIDIKWILGNDMSKVFHNLHINLIKESWIFTVQTKNGGMLYCPDHIHEMFYK